MSKISVIEWFACARLSESYLPRSSAVTFPNAHYPRSLHYKGINDNTRSIVQNAATLPIL